MHLTAVVKFERTAGNQRRVVRRVKPAHASLHLAQVMRTRNDFLTRIATFGKRHRLHQVQVQHLGGELTRSCSEDLRRAITDVVSLPDGFRPTLAFGNRLQPRRHDQLP